MSSMRNSQTTTAAESRLNLLVRYLDHAVDDDQLRCFFLPFGQVTSSMVMRDILTGESRGFGFVRFARHDDAAAALAEANGKKICGKAVNVLWAKQQHDAAPAGQDRLKMNKLFLRNVPVDVTEQQLVALVRRCGEVTEVSLHNDKISAACNAPSRRIAFIVFRTEGAADAALHAVHNTCPFPGCYDVPLMAKLSEDYKAKTSSSSVSNGSGSGGAVGPQRSRAAPPVPVLAASARRLSVEVTTVPTIMKFAEHSCRYNSPPTSTTARSPGVSSLGPSLESNSLEEGAATSAVRPMMSATELEGSLHSSFLSLRTPVRRASSDSLVYRHNPYASAQIMPAALMSSTTSIFSDSPLVACETRTA